MDGSDDSDGVTGPPSTAMDIDADVNDSEVEDAIVEEAVEDDEAELGLYKSQYRKIYLQLNGGTHVQKMDFTSLCVLQKKPQIEYKNSRHAHVFECGAGRCKGRNSRYVYRFLDKGDANSMSNLLCNVKICWGGDVSIHCHMRS